MPKNQAQRMLFAFLTVLITVHAYVFYSLYVVNGSTLMEVASLVSGKQINHVIPAINVLGGIEVLGHRIAIWGVVAVEFCLAYLLEVVLGSPCSFKLASKCFDPKDTHPVLFETAIICATAGLMCPVMSLIAAFLYYPYSTMDFNIFTLLANWLKLVCLNFPFAVLSQLFFIQPFVRTIFRAIFTRKVRVGKTVSYQ